VLQQPRFPATGRALPNHKIIRALLSFEDVVLQQPRFPDIERVSPNKTENSWKSFGDLVLQQPGFPRPYQDRVNWLFCRRMGSTQHNSMFGDLVLK